MLLNLYVEQLENKDLFEEAIEKQKLLKASDFQSEQELNEAVIALAASIEILPPVNLDEKQRERGESRKYWSIVFEHKDKEEWKSLLSAVGEKANLRVQNSLKQLFETSLQVAQFKKKFQIEDIDTKIENTIADYQRTTSDRLAFLEEQATIARKLGVAKNTLEAQTLSAGNSLVANISNESPFYLRGYEAIEEEIELIQSRDNPKAFMRGLFDLEKERRTLQQDKTLDRAQALFERTLLKTKDFLAVEFKPASTDFGESNFLLKIIATLVISGMIGVFYVLLAAGLKNRKES